LRREKIREKEGSRGNEEKKELKLKNN